MKKLATVTGKSKKFTKAAGKKLKKGGRLKLKVKTTPANKKLKVRKHRVIKYESRNTKVATVTAKGVVKAKAKGTCYIYVYAQNGVSKRIKITVK